MKLKELKRLICCHVRFEVYEGDYNFQRRYVTTATFDLNENDGIAGFDSFIETYGDARVDALCATDDELCFDITEAGTYPAYEGMTIYTDENGNVHQYVKPFENKDDAIHWAKLNDGNVFDLETGEAIFLSMECDNN